MKLTTRFPLLACALPLILLSACHATASNVSRSSSATSAPPLRVMSFNLRYNNPGDGINAWPNRKDWVAGLIKFHEADVIGVQEALVGMLEDLDTRLPGFARVGVGRTDGKRAGEYSAIIYRTDRVSLQDSGTFWLSPTPEVVASKGWDAALERIATWGRFTDRRTGCSYVHLNTHFDHIGEKARQESARIIRHRLAILSNGLPVIVTGDLNSNPESIAYRTLTGETIAGAVAPLSDAMLVSKTGHYGPTSSWTEFKAIVPGQRIDYVLVSSGVTVLSHAILPDSWDNRFPSDHLPVIAALVPACR